MKIVAVVTNRVESYDLFISKLYPAYRDAFRFLKIEDASRLKGLTAPVMFTQLSHPVVHHESIDVVTRLESFAVPRFDPYDFTKDTPEISKFL